MSDETFDQLKDMFYQGRPCSYHYTKSLAEQLVAEQVQAGYVSSYLYKSSELSHCQESSPPPSSSCSTSSATSSLPPSSPLLRSHLRLRPFPAAIVRPSIITSAWRDPFPGWVDNYNGTTGFLVVNGKGVLRTIHVQEEYVTDLIPVDVVISTCISAAWYIAACRRQTSDFVSRNSMLRRDSSDSSGVSSAGDCEPETGNGDVFVVNCVSGESSISHYLFLDSDLHCFCSPSQNRRSQSINMGRSS